MNKFTINDIDDAKAHEVCVYFFYSLTFHIEIIVSHTEHNYSSSCWFFVFAASQPKTHHLFVRDGRTLNFIYDFTIYYFARCEWWQFQSNFMTILSKCARFFTWITLFYGTHSHTHKRMIWFYCLKINGRINLFTVIFLWQNLSRFWCLQHRMQNEIIIWKQLFPSNKMDFAFSF